VTSHPGRQPSRPTGRRRLRPAVRSVNAAGSWHCRSLTISEALGDRSSHGICFAPPARHRRPLPSTSRPALARSIQHLTGRTTATIQQISAPAAPAPSNQPPRASPTLLPSWSPTWPPATATTALSTASAAPGQPTPSASATTSPIQHHLRQFSLESENLSQRLTSDCLLVAESSH
jgi:hypothetical protein